MIRNKIEQIWFNHVYPCLQNNSYLPLDLTKQFQILIILTSDIYKKSVKSVILAAHIGTILKDFLRTIL